MAVNLMEYFNDHEHDVFVLLTEANSEGIEFQDIPEGVKIIPLIAPKLPRLLRPIYRRLKPYLMIMWLKRHIKRIQPTYIISTRHTATAPCYKAWKLASKPGSFFIREINPINKTLTNKKDRIPLIREAYINADGVIANSIDVGEALKEKNWTPAHKIHVVDNPVIFKNFYKKAAESVHDEWVEDTAVPLIVSIGRLSYMKDQPTMIKAFKLIHAQRNCRLMIIGEGKDRPELERLIQENDLQDSILLAGERENPYPYLKRADLFLLTSCFEGFGVVLVEALALGKKIVSTHCVGGPGPILNYGEFGRLVPVGDIQAISAAVIESLDAEVDEQKLIARAQEFSVEAIGKKYETIMLAGKS